MNCIFCDIATKKSHAEVLYEDTKTISFLDIRPLNYGHTLIIPKIHYNDFLAVPSDELSYIIHKVQYLTTAVQKALKCEGFNIISNNGKSAGQSVFHFHFHIIPRFNSDTFKVKLNFRKYSDGQMKEFADKIRSELN